jgi:hypothetical protein
MIIAKSFPHLLAEAENFSHRCLNKLHFKIKKFFVEI